MSLNQNGGANVFHLFTKELHLHSLQRLKPQFCHFLDADTTTFCRTYKSALKCTLCPFDRLRFSPHFLFGIAFKQ